MKRKIKVGINGFGRIGRIAARIILKRDNLELAAVNSRAQAQSHAYLLKYDSTYGTFDLSVDHKDEQIVVNGNKIAALNFASPAEIPWNKYGVDIVIDATGKFRTKNDLQGHLKNGPEYVVLSAPAKDDTKTLVMGVNNHEFSPSTDKIVSNSSCTTNCLSVVTSVLHKHSKINKAFMTTTHAVTDSQNLLDNSAGEVRSRRSSITSIIPASTGSAKDIVKLFPDLSGKIICQSLRVPTATVSLINLVACLDKKTIKEEINSAFEKASKTSLKGILGLAQEKLVSVDYKGSVYSAVYDHFLTDVIDGNMVNLYAWYDNEWGYAARLIDLVSFISEKAKL